eukprot:Opistho-2@76505
MARRPSDVGVKSGEVDPVRGSRHVRTLEVLEKSQEQSRALQNRIDYLEDAIQSCQHLHEQARTADQRIEEERAKATEAVKVALAELSEKHDEKLRQIYAREQSTINHFTSERQAFEARITHLEQALSVASTKADALELENTSMKSTLEHATGKNATLEGVVSDLDGKAQLLQLTLEELDDLKRLYAIVDQKAKDLEFDNGALADRLKALSSGEEDPAISAMIADLRLDIDHHKQEIRARDASIEQLRAEAARERDCVSQCTLEIGRLTKELSASTKACAELTAQVADLTERLTETQRTANALAVAASSKKSIAAPSFEDFVSLNRTVTELKQENTAMKRRSSMIPSMFPNYELPEISAPSPSQSTRVGNMSPRTASPAGSMTSVAAPIPYKDQDGVVVVQKSSLPFAMQRRGSLAQGVQAATGVTGGNAGGGQAPSKWASSGNARRASSAQINLPRNPL